MIERGTIANHYHTNRITCLKLSQTFLRRLTIYNTLNNAADGATHPKMPPCAAIIFKPTCWNSGKYDATQSDSTSHS